MSVLQDTGKQSAVGVYSANASFGSPVTVGSLIVLLIPHYAVSGSAGVVSVTDNQGNSYNVDVDYSAAAQSPSIASGRADVASGTFTVTINFSNPCTVDWSMLEVSSIDPSAWLDQGGISYQASVDPVVVTAGGANSSVNEFVVAVAQPLAGAISGTPSTGYTDSFTDAVSTGGRGSYKTVSSIETSSASFPYATANAAFVAIATYKMAANPTPTANKVGSLLMAYQ